MGGNLLVRRVVEKCLPGEKLKKLDHEEYSAIHGVVRRALANSLPVGKTIEDFEESKVARLVRLGRSDEARAIQSEAEEIAGKDSPLVLGKLPGRVHIGSPKSAPNPAECCLVLSGGGARGAFEVGFLASIRDVWDKLNVTAVSGTSVGAVNAVAIAQDGVDGVDTLVDLWLDLQGNSDMFTKHVSVQVPEQELKSIGLDLNIEDLASGNVSAAMAALGNALGVSMEDEAYSAATAPALLAGGAMIGGSVGLALVVIGIKIICDAVSSAAGDLALLETKAEIMKSAIPKLLSCKGFRDFGPLRTKLVQNLDPSKIGTSRRPKMRLCMVCLEDGKPYYFTEDGQLLAGNGNPKKADSFCEPGLDLQKVVNAVIASSSVPVFFPAIPITATPGSTKCHFVDGGLREVLPVRSAVEMGYARVLGVLTSSLGFENVEFGESPPAALSLITRVMAIMNHEVTIADTEVLSDIEDGRLVYPFTNTTGEFEVDPGTIRINMDYGYMTGYEATLSERERDVDGWTFFLAWLAKEAIIQLRREVWDLEAKVVRQVPAPNQWATVFEQNYLATIRNKKRQVLEWTLIRFHAMGDDPACLPVAVAGRHGNRTNIHDWWSTWEQHSGKWLASVLAQNELWSQLCIGVSPVLGDPVLEPQVGEMPSTDAF